ncbi:hypothetical protein JN00_0425 [Metamycoplasma subdolum]|uniref:YlxR domain-containing protein n=1 Tax=Metamycoplasma subdolum TaxID=92407 RepID=A0A3L9ZZK4_9BACT|nr:YlxR family protein [Metamycoplasma subdolum]RMA77574.1 hypothetical protein JN00_0425 [Metamycoplasma subdolum]WPB50368.1 YlxR family protein [Metamycoplasma subdolum]
MKSDKRIERKSISNNTKYTLDKLIRFVKQKDGKILFDIDQKLGGRGAYCLNDEENIEILFRKKLLNKAFKQNISQEVYDNLRNEVAIWQKKRKDNQI